MASILKQNHFMKGLGIVKHPYLVQASDTWSGVVGSIPHQGAGGAFIGLCVASLKMKSSLSEDMNHS